MMMTMVELTPEQWTLGLLGALFIGLAKGGIPAFGNLTAGIYAVIFASKASVGILLPILISADIIAVIIYRKHALWSYLLKLFPWTFAGLILGWLCFGVVSDRQVQVIIGVILISMTAVHGFRKWVMRHRDSPVPRSGGRILFAGCTGILAGFSTMMANAAGPVAALYLMAMKLPKYAFIGTSAWFFFIVNGVKVPFMVQLGIIHFESLGTSLSLMPAAITGALVAPRIVKYINQRAFEFLIWLFIVVAGIGLLFRPDWPSLIFQYAS